MKKLVSLIILFSITSILTLTGCNMKSSDIIPETIIAKAMEADKNIKTYYSEAKLQTYENDKLMSEETMKIWNDMSGSTLKVRVEGKSKDSELVSTNDGKKIIIYNKKDNSAIVMDSPSKDVSMSMIQTPKETFLKLMEKLKDSYNITTENEEKINGFSTVHISAKKKNKNTITGDMDFWIDKETWFAVKTISQVSNTKIVCEYTKIDTKAKMQESLFTQSLPVNAKVEKNELGLNDKKSTLNEASKLLKNPILHVPESSEYKLVDVKQLHYDSKELPIEFEQTYERNGKNAFTISLVLPKEKSDHDLELPGAEKIEIRGKKGIIYNNNGFLICWGENNLNYSVITDNAEISLDEIKSVINTMVNNK